MSQERSVRASAAPGRVLTVDLLRLLATFQMVQGHTIDAVLGAAHRAGALHAGWLYLRGLTSVAFLFVAGLSFHLATLRRFERHRADRGAVERRFRRAGTLLLVGYLLHFPADYFLADDPLRQQRALEQASIVDVLHAIGLSLAALELLVLALPSAQAVARVCAGLGALLLLGAPFLVELDPGGFLRPLLNYVTPAGGSIFPLLPWAGHIFAGVALSPFMLAGSLPRRAALVALALLLSAQLAAAVGSPLVADHLSRLGWVCAGCGLLALLEGAAGSWPRWLWVLSGETLFIYVVHIWLCYGQGVGLRDLVGPSLAPLPALGGAAAMLLLSGFGALAYHRRKTAITR
ncbi:MAG: DUF1624 domain-containing protein [Myxococcales bacterium]|nr:DUF1624 domain-containing protein [Myxococcales bacterium]